MKDKVLTAIRLITATKIMNRQEPHYALFQEVIDETGLTYSQVREYCAELFREGKIDGGRTMHDSWVKPK